MKRINTYISKTLAFLTALIMLCGTFAGCSDKTGNKGLDTEGKKISIVTTIFPEYDWVRQILGDKAGNADITMLLDSGVDLHSYQPTADDIIKISTCDLFIYVGGESDAWVGDALDKTNGNEIKVVNLLDVLGDAVKEEESVEGMQPENEGGEGEEEKESDEHVWLSLKNAETVCKAIADKLSEIDPANTATYKANLNTYIENLSALDTEYKSTADTAKIKVLLFGDRFPFRYLTDDYGITYYAAFVGCSAETEASFETISFLSKKVDELHLSCVMTLEGTDHRIAETIIGNTKSKDQQILRMDSMQSTTSDDVKNGATYLSIMQKNLEALKTALK